MPTLSNILSAPDARARMRPGMEVYANTDMDSPQLWLDTAGAERRNLAKGTRVGIAQRFVANAEGGYVFVGFSDGTWMPVTHAAIVSEQKAIEPDAREQLVQLLQRDRVLAHQLLAIDDIARRVQLTTADRALVEQLKMRLAARQSEVLKAGWLARVEQGFDRAWKGVLDALGFPAAPVSGLPAIPIAAYALVAALAVGALVIWLSSRNPQSVADFRASLDLYNRLRAALPPAEQQNFDKLITDTADSAAAQAQSGPLDKIGEWGIVGGLVVAGVLYGPKLLNKLFKGSGKKGGRRG
jgi:hypothetical protein